VAGRGDGAQSVFREERGRAGEQEAEGFELRGGGGEGEPGEEALEGARFLAAGEFQCDVIAQSGIVHEGEEGAGGDLREEAAAQGEAVLLSQAGGRPTGFGEERSGKTDGTPVGAMEEGSEGRGGGEAERAKGFGGGGRDGGVAVEEAGHEEGGGVGMGEAVEDPDGEAADGGVAVLKGRREGGESSGAQIREGLGSGLAEILVGVLKGIGQRRGRLRRAQGAEGPGGGEAGRVVPGGEGVEAGLERGKVTEEAEGGEQAGEAGRFAEGEEREKRRDGGRAEGEERVPIAGKKGGASRLAAEDLLPGELAEAGAGGGAEFNGIAAIVATAFNDATHFNGGEEPGGVEERERHLRRVMLQIAGGGVERRLDQRHIFPGRRGFEDARQERLQGLGAVEGEERGGEGEASERRQARQQTESGAGVELKDEVSGGVAAGGGRRGEGLEGGRIGPLDEGGGDRGGGAVRAPGEREGGGGIAEPDESGGETLSGGARGRGEEEGREQRNSFARGICAQRLDERRDERPIGTGLRGELKLAQQGGRAGDGMQGPGGGEEQIGGVRAGGRKGMEKGEQGR